MENSNSRTKANAVLTESIQRNITTLVKEEEKAENPKQAVLLDPIFKVIEDTKALYSEGMIDKTETLEKLAKLIGSAVLRNSAYNRSWNAKYRRETIELRQIVEHYEGREA